MIRILHVVTYMGRGGLETMLMNYYRNIDRKKVQFDFLVHRDFEADYDQEILELGGRIHHISRLIPWSHNYKRELKNFFKNHPEYQIVHVHQDCLSSVALQCAKECGIPVRIAHCHSAGAVKNLKYPIKLFYMKKIPNVSTDQFSCGKTAGDWMFSGTPYYIVANAVDLEKYQYSDSERTRIREEFQLNDQFVIGHVGNFTPAKNHPFLLEILRQMLKYDDKSMLLLIGAGEEIQELEKLAADMGISNHVIFAGMRTDVYDCLSAMDVFVFPSLYEGLPVTMIEAQASGIQCLISDKVSAECIVTADQVSIKKLDESAEDWCKQILKLRSKGRKDSYREIRDAGYDIHIEAIKLQNYYIQKCKELK